MNGVLRFIAFSLLSYVGCDYEKEAKLRFYHSSIDEFTELTIQTAQEILSYSNWYDSSRPTVIFAHGFTGHPKGPAVTSVISTLIDEGKSNVALLNWDYLASATVVPGGIANSYVTWAAPNARKLAVTFAGTLMDLADAGLDLNRTHFVGHSLGAHIFGISGNILKAKQSPLSWITGLDPAGVGFENKPLPARLHAGSAAFVTVIHSDPSKYGFRKSLGTVDFWPNFRVGPVLQPGCDGRPNPMFSPEDLCSHNRCWQFFTEAIKNPGSVIGSHAKNYRTWKNYSEQQRKAYTLDIAVNTPSSKSGNYYFSTNAKAPFGKNTEGL